MGTVMSRLKARVTPKTKSLLQQAADLEGRILTDFVIASVQAEAYRVIERHQKLKLSREDGEAFVNALLNPPQPNHVLKSAAQRHTHAIEYPHSIDIN